MKKTLSLRVTGLALIAFLFNNFICCLDVKADGGPVCTPPPTNLIAWWRAEGNAIDFVGSNHGILTNGGGYTNGMVGMAFGFTGSSNCIVVPYSANLAPTNYTIEAWIKPTAQINNPENQAVIFAQGRGRMQLVARKGTTGVYVALLFAAGGSFPDVQSTVQIPIGSFTHIAGTWDGTTFRLYINGTLNNQSTPGTLPDDSGCDFFIGGFYVPIVGTYCEYVGQFFGGFIDEVSLYSRTLSPSEIQSIYAADGMGKCPLTPTPPSIITQPTDQTVASGNSASFFVNVFGSTNLVYQWWRGQTNISGATNSILTLSNVQTGDEGNYYVVVTNLYGSTTSSNGLLIVTNRAPFIITQPQSTNVPAGGSATFTVVTGGSLPLGYQWYFNTNNLINGATNASLTVNSIQLAQVGTYSLRVTNAYGLTNSSNAILSIVLPTPFIRALNTNAMGGAPVTLPIEIGANGNESTLGFSVNFSTQRLAFAGVTWGSGVSGAARFVNTNQVNSGRVGFGVTFPPGASFTTATQRIVEITFNSLPVLGASSVNTAISFGDQPVLRELYNALLQTISVNYSNSTITLFPTIFESDVFPRTNGNQAVTTTDWAQMARFVARIDIAVGQEFQRADCAPKNILGDGQMKVTDWVQGGRYIAGLDPLVALGGPSNEIAPVLAGPSGSRQFRVTDTNILHGESADVSVILDAQGNENALGSTITFNPAAMTYSGLNLGSGATGASLTVNTSEVSFGRIGVVLALPTGTTFSAGSEEMVQVSFVASSDVVGPFPVSLTDQLVVRCVSDVFANELPVSYVSGTITINPINPNPTLAISRSDTSVVLSWPLWAADFFLQTSGGTNGQGVWTNASITLQTNGSIVFTMSPVGNASKFFRLYHP